ncbi:hypothetical protein C2857_005665 [Epichloe festucae Fl1]|uniref:Uncharacterized protein n=1 Tax=Epichloe festucae (strain Fl1) TaxID=877507 RepID=A0A7S9KSY7_EPIFF|nr:hypothetical protein C2857_005665 [Epichloe festucae Fl1]
MSGALGWADLFSSWNILAGGAAGRGVCESGFSSGTRRCLPQINGRYYCIRRIRLPCLLVLAAHLKDVLDFKLGQADGGMRIGYGVSPIMLVCITTVAYLFPVSWRDQARRSFQFSVNRNPTLRSSAHRPNY